MGVFWIETPALNSKGHNIGLVFETAAETIDDLVAVLGDRGIVGGANLITVDDGRGGRLVRRRTPAAITARGIARITPYMWRIWEPEDAPATA